MSSLEAQPKIAPARGLKDLTRQVQHAEGFPGVLASLKNGRSATIDGAWGSAGPLAAAALGLHATSTLLIVLAHVGDVDDFRDDVGTFAGINPEVFPAWDKHPTEVAPGDEVFGRRLRVLRALRSDAPPRIIVAPMQALLQPVPLPDLLDQGARKVRVGDTIAVEELAGWLVDRGMTRVEVVEVAGEFSLRGGILDVFPVDGDAPIRIEFFGDDVESIRPFDPESQRSLGQWTEAVLSGAPAWSAEGLGHLTDYLPDRSWVALVEPNDLREEGRHYLGRLDDKAGIDTVEKAFARLVKFPSITLSTIAASSLEATAHLRVESIERFSGELQKVKAELDSAAGKDRVLIACHNEAEAERLREVFADSEIARSGRLELTVGRVRAGFHMIDARTLVIGDHELFARTDVRRPVTRRRYESRAIDSFLDLNEGDLVVHVNHGIARYRGLHAGQPLGRPRRGDAAPRVRRGGEDLRAGRQDRPRPEVRRRRQGRAVAVEDRVVGLGEAEEAGGRGRRRPRGRADRHPGRPRQPAGHRLSGRGLALDGRVRGRVSLRGDARPALGDRGPQARHGEAPADGPARLRRRRLRQDRGRHAGRVQGGRRRQAGRRSSCRRRSSPSSTTAASRSGWPSSRSRSRSSTASARRPRSRTSSSARPPARSTS